MVGDDGVGRGVRLVEAILGELGHQVEQLLGQRRVITFLLGPGGDGRPMPVSYTHLKLPPSDLV